MRKLSKSLFLMSVCALYGWGMAPAEARTCFIVGDCGGYLSRKDTVSTTHSCEDLGYKYNKDECIASGKVPTGRNCGDNYEKCLCDRNVYVYNVAEISNPYEKAGAECTDTEGTYSKYEVCQAKYKYLGAIKGNLSSIGIESPSGDNQGGRSKCTWWNIYNDGTTPAWLNSPEGVHNYIHLPEGAAISSTGVPQGECVEHYVANKCGVDSAAILASKYEKITCAPKYKYISNDLTPPFAIDTYEGFCVTRGVDENDGKYKYAGVKCSNNTTAVPTGETNVTGAWKAQCADTETYSARFDATVDNVTCHWCYQKCDTSEYPWLEADILPPYTKTLANNITNPSCTDSDGTHYKYKVCQSQYRYTYDIWTVPRYDIYHDAVNTYSGGDEPYMAASNNSCKELISQTGHDYDGLYRYDDYLCSRSYFPYVWDEGDTEYRLIETDYTIFNVGDQCGDVNGNYTRSLSCSGDTAHAPKGETHTTGAWKANCAGNETHNSQYDATVGGVTCHWCYAQPCTYMTQASCESSNAGFTCSRASDTCYYPASCKSPYSNTQPSICKKYDGQIDLERLITKTAKNSSGTTIKCFSKEKIPCKELRYHGSLIGYDADGWPRTFYNRITIYEATSITAGGTGCETRYCYKPNVSIQAEIGDSITCFKTGMDTIRGTYRGYVNDATAQGLVNVEGYNCSIYKDGKTYITIPTGDGFHVKPN